AKGASTSSQSTSFGEFVELRIVDLSMLVFLLQFNETTDVRAGTTQDTYNYENYYLVTNGNSQLVKSELVTEYHYPYTGSGSSIFTIDTTNWDHTSSGDCTPPTGSCSGSGKIIKSCSTSSIAPDTP
ncbi:MAG: hypothetical protein GY829_01110, partial [Gammaproteobacteria bacterium]|nr:hypothetical protein [Gammaproteobacteria bacterium]